MTIIVNPAIGLYYDAFRRTIAPRDYDATVIRERAMRAVCALLYLDIIVPGRDHDTTIGNEYFAMGHYPAMIEHFAANGNVDGDAVPRYVKSNEHIRSIYAVSVLETVVSMVVRAHDSQSCGLSCNVCESMSRATAMLAAANSLLTEHDRKLLRDVRTIMDPRLVHSTRFAYGYNDGQHVLDVRCATCGTVAIVPFASIDHAHIACSDHEVQEIERARRDGKID